MITARVFYFSFLWLLLVSCDNSKESSRSTSTENTESDGLALVSTYKNCNGYCTINLEKKIINWQICAATRDEENQGGMKKCAEDGGSYYWPDSAACTGSAVCTPPTPTPVPPTPTPLPKKKCTCYCGNESGAMLYSDYNCSQTLHYPDGKWGRNYGDCEDAEGEMCSGYKKMYPECIKYGGSPLPGETAPVYSGCEMR